MITRYVAVVNIACVQQEGLFQEISDLQKELKETKAAQDTQIRAIRDEVKNDTKTQIVQSMQYVVRYDTGQPRRHSHGISDILCAEARFSPSLRTQLPPRWGQR